MPPSWLGTDPQRLGVSPGLPLTIPGDDGERDSLWVTSKGLLITMGPVSTSLSTSLSPASSEPLLASVGKFVLEETGIPGHFNPCGLRGRIGGE